MPSNLSRTSVNLRGRWGSGQLLPLYAAPHHRRELAMPPEASVAVTVDVTMTVNGRPVALASEPRAILLDVLRDRLGLTGAKRSCDAQVCGACTVLLDGAPT